MHSLSPLAFAKAPQYSRSAHSTLLKASCLEVIKVAQMRLLNVHSYELEEFLEADIPSYVILSHTWGKEEVSFEDWVHRRPEIGAREGYQKISSLCTEAQSYGFSWVWIDTCCIDKKSSAELSEAINSMYKWYQQASECYAYLTDVPAGSPETIRTQDSAFRNSRWFTRGWTLQELLAPTSVVFYAKDWSEPGTKSGLRDLLTSITRVDMQKMSEGGLRYFSVAQKMSWASSRKTTRTEDMA